MTYSDGQISSVFARLKTQFAAKRLVTAAILAAFAVPSAEAVFVASSAHAQVVADGIFGDTNTSLAKEQLLLESDDLEFDQNRDLVIATGNVQIAYGKTTLVADKVEYNQQSGRVIAFGNVEIIEPSGNRIFANEIDVTDDFRDGFVSALNVRTVDNTRIAAESAERRDGSTTVFNNGVYTACEECKKDPTKPPFWQIRAKKVIVDGETRTVSYEDATFELFGRPFLKLPHFSHADPAVKRKSGFLLPTFNNSEVRGAGYRQGYFFNLAPSYDVTLWGTYFSRQGALGEAQWRQRLANGEYSIHYAGIRQQDRGAFDAGTIDAAKDWRHAVATKGLFEINPRWKFGWDALFQSDENFARTYNIEGRGDLHETNEVYLIGTGDKNYFDLRVQDYLVQSNLFDASPAPNGIPGNQHATEQQALALPIFDYNAVSGEEFGNGQISFDLNVANIQRNAPDVANFDNNAAVIAANERFAGLSGNSARASGVLEWKGSSVLDSGFVATAALNVQADAIQQNHDNPGSTTNPLLSNRSIYRYMPAARFEIRLPMIAQQGSTTHILEPIAQIIARPDETRIGEFANEDAQSLVFDTSNLFSQNKFSGYDRVEGGTRANIGVRWSSTFEDGSSLNFVAGQSFHLAGQNSFASTADLTNVGEESGLETDRSDVVASVQYDNGTGLAFGTGVRLDEADLQLKRAEFSGRISQPDYSLIASYAFTEAQPNYRFNRDRHEVSGSASVKLSEYWRAFGASTYDLVENSFVSNSVGVAYDDSCFSFSVAYSQQNSKFSSGANDHSINFSLGLRTIGGFDRSVNFGQENN